ncbi:hypothetical protein FHG66_18220 [Rubellimicrobium rubrum]|uniref:DUF3619 family protein n=1 Tax=Rubellimicrobium rubrum TaxID=2585369 RepID=A0A5C4MRQ9_9RHOB|nr:hypothetical protein [Rubellimicrobium rubrum]TNC46796.1 hypothetical protein FHG66_18220 [Rubellimicrobium rubrum]
MSRAAFDDRINAIEEKNQRLALGVEYRIGADGLIEARPRRRMTRRPPFRGIAMVLTAALGLKAALFIGMGEATYEARRADLVVGNRAEQVAAWLMQPDPAVRGVALAVTLFSR